MVMVGVFAWQLGGRALWLVPTTFIAVMAIGGALGIAGIGVPFVEIGIAVSVVVFGAIVAFDLKAPTVAAMGVVGLFAVFHGHAHGAEIPEDAGRIVDRRVLHLIKMWLDCPVEETDKRGRKTRTTEAHLQR
jgi:urease accessory protein